LFEAALRVVCPTVKSPVVNSTSGDTEVKSTHACFSPAHPYAKISTGLSVRMRTFYWPGRVWIQYCGANTPLINAWGIWNACMLRQYESGRS
jgi:hypothetical protein